ncbi:unnamed protein product, partial [Pylaiella littoralis]
KSSSAGGSRAETKRTRQAPSHTTATKIPIHERHPPFKNGSISEPDDTAVKAEVKVFSKVDPRRALAIEAVAGEGATPVEDCSYADSESTVKTEVGIVFPSKYAVAGGQLEAQEPDERNASVARLYPYGRSTALRTPSLLWAVTGSRPFCPVVMPT